LLVEDSAEQQIAVIDCIDSPLAAKISENPINALFSKVFGTKFEHNVTYLKALYKVDEDVSQLTKMVEKWAASDKMVLDEWPASEDEPLLGNTLPQTKWIRPPLRNHASTSQLRAPNNFKTNSNHLVKSQSVAERIAAVVETPAISK
jgi:hypothetical protein